MLLQKYFFFENDVLNKKANLQISTKEETGDKTQVEKIRLDNERILSEIEDISYYQWVPLMLAISALIFKIPRLVWKQLEGGTIKNFYFMDEEKSELKSHLADDEMKGYVKLL